MLRAVAIHVRLLIWGIGAIAIAAAYRPSAANAQVAASTLEGVSDSNGDPSYTPPLPISPPQSGSGSIIYEGVVLNAPSDMLSTAASSTLSSSNSTTTFSGYGQWQTFVQSNVVANDYGGVALYAAQNYAFTDGDPSNFYSVANWNANVTRLDSYPLNPTTTGTGSPYPVVQAGQQLQAGDEVEVIANGGLFYEGKWNINEEHFTNTSDANEYQFSLVYLGHPGLPTPISLALSTIESTNSTPNFSTDTSLLSNPEHYQGDLVTLTSVQLVPGQQANWLAGAGAGGLSPVMVEDSSGREFPLWLGTSSLFTPANAPAGFFNVTGIFDQESSAAGPYNVGYNLYVVSPVPEPSSWALAASGLIAMLGWKLRRPRVR